MSERVVDFFAWIFATVVALALVYVASAPPIMSSIARASGGAFSSFYVPVIWMIESDLNGPLLWYFNDVWGCGIELIGDVTTPWYIVAAYVFLGLVFAGVLLLPFWRKHRKPRVA